jgi:hypothetical protein
VRFIRAADYPCRGRCLIIIRALKLMMVEKSENPSALKNIKRHLLPVNYYYQKARWMDRMIFNDWLLNHFVPESEMRSFLEKNDMPLKTK